MSGSLCQDFAGQWIDIGDAFDLVAEEFHPHRDFFISRINLEGVAPCTERARVSVMSFRSYWMSIR